jgi:hypothetical protein
VLARREGPEGHAGGLALRKSPATPGPRQKQKGRPNLPKGPPPPKPTTMKPGPVLHSEQSALCSTMNTAWCSTVPARALFKT